MFISSITYPFPKVKRKHQSFWSKTKGKGFIFMENNRIRYTVEKVLSNSFYQLPKFLFTGELKNISNDARVLYALLRDRHELSIKNQWINAKHEVYHIMSRETMCDMLGLSHKTVIKAINDLKRYNLLEEERKGQGKVNLLYLLECGGLSTGFSDLSTDFTASTSRPGDITGLNLENSTSRPGDITGLNLENLQAIHINHHHINHSHTYSSHNDFDRSEETPKTDFSDKSDSYDAYKDYNPKVNHNPFENLDSKYLNRQAEITEIKSIISTMNSTPRTSVHIGKKDIPVYEIKSALSKLTSRHIENVLDSLQRKSLSNNPTVKDRPAYILASLYNSATKPLPFDVELIQSTVRRNIGFDSLLLKYPDKYEQEHLVELYNIIVEVLITRKDFFRIGKGELPAATVKHNFCSLTSAHVTQVLDTIRTNTSEVKSAKSYIQTCLYNSVSALNIQDTLNVNNHLFEHLGIQKK